MPERTLAVGCGYGRRVAAKIASQMEGGFGASDSASSSKPSTEKRWFDLPQILIILVFHLVGPWDFCCFALVNRRFSDIGLSDAVWRFFCRSRWGSSSNFSVYTNAKALFRDSNGWFPYQGASPHPPCFEVQRLRLHKTRCLTMDLRITDEEIVAVSEAPRDATTSKVLQQASVQILETSTGRLRERFDVSNATINCCDVNPGQICLGSDDSKVRLYRRSSSSTGGDENYQLACEYSCASVVNDLRYAREDFIVAVRTHLNRHPAGMDIIPVERPDARVTLPGGSWTTRGKYIHAIDAFEEGCTLGEIACSGEHPLTSAFSAMLFDFRRSAPCVVDLAVACVRQGHPVGTRLWPLRAGRSPRVYANLLREEGPKRKQGAIAMVDFRYPSMDARDTLFHLPDPIDDFRVFNGSIYTVGTDNASCRQRLRVHRCSTTWPGSVEVLSTVDEAYDAEGRNPREDLKVFSISQRGFVASYGEHLALGSIVEPSWRRPLL
eukprot:TRINITY_DN18774_c0_g1_i3.p1 TRINITY_DN18774_c0_g1~~TRINITY_DN18774_c0_g1_i3.p1  ORF type:complete len:494 (+),score=51.95 TRINITY_DN18774_c0_g1_i3:402-1883(+)